MYKRLPISQKQELIKRVKAGESIVKLCKEVNISRTILYKWVKAYEATGPRAKKKVLASKVSTGKRHWKALNSKTELAIRNFAIKNPTCTPTEVAKKLGVSVHGVWNVLKRANLNTQEARLAYVSLKGQSLVNELPYTTKVSLMNRIERGEKVTALARELGISRTIIYRWLKNYREAKGSERALEVARPKAADHWRHVPGLEQLLLPIITANPTLNLEQLVLEAKKQTPQVGRHAIYNLLKRLGLSTYQQRVAFANAHQVPIIESPQADPVYLPATPRYSFSSFLAPPFTEQFNKLQLFFFFFGITFITSLTLLFMGSIVMGAHGVAGKIGMIFAFISLFCGMFFFVYSLKSYITIAFVLSYSRKAQDSTGHFIKRAWWQSLLSDIFGLELTIETEGDENSPVVIDKQAPGLVADLSNVVLESYPFISVHVSIYNEKRVIDRLLTACTSFDYPNYEVVVADDSTDETYDLIKKWENHPRVKISHRENRDGYKGQALQQALRVTDPRAQYIAIFDADFIPYPDSLTQFLKYMQVAVGTLDPKTVQASPIAAVQGYQWHVLNKSENWVTRGIRTEYAGSYVIERSGEEIYNGLKQISGSVYMIRKDVVQKIGWGRSITEDFQFTLRLYEAGFKVVYTPYVQAPAEAASTIKRLIRQRMRWSEGHSFNVHRMFKRLMFGRFEMHGDEKRWVPSPLTRAEKLEFLYLAPYYLQAALFIIGTIAWFLAEAVFQVRLPFWTEVWGWSLVLTNLFALPLMNMVGLFMEETEEKDYLGLFSFVALSYIVAPFQAYAAIKGFVEKEEGPWFRTPKTGRITDTFLPGKVYRFVKGWFGSKQSTSVGKHAMASANLNSYVALATANNTFNNFFIKKKKMRRVGNLSLGILLILVTLVSGLAPYIPATQQVYASQKLATIDEIMEEQDAQKANEEALDKATAPNRAENLLKNAQTETIDTPRIVTKPTKGGKQVSFVFHKEARVRVLLDKHEIELTAQTVAGKRINPSKATIYKDQEVVYRDVLKGVDLKYTIGNDVISEEYIVKDREAAKYFDTQRTITSQMKAIGVNVVTVDKSTFGLYSKDGKELFRFASPFAKDAKGVVTNDIDLTLEKAKTGYTLSKVLSSNAIRWLNDASRAFPVAIDPSVVVSGGIVDAETQFGGLQRKVAYVNGNWYAFHSDGNDVFYKKSADGVSWGANVDMDGTDADNINPSISVSGNTIIAFWFDTGSNFVQGRTVNTASADAQGTLCSSSSLGTISSTFMNTVAAYSTTGAVVAFSDTGADTEVDIFNITGLGGSCTVTDVEPGNITFGSGITAGDRPVVVPVSATNVTMIFQDGNLSYSKFNPAINDWTSNNLTVAAVTDNVYSVTTDGTTVWALSVSGTTATNLYSCCATGFTETQGDADIGGAGQDGVSDIDIACPTATDCKLVYTDDVDTTAPKIQFVDCDDATCSTATNTTIDTDIGAAGDQAGASLYCVTATDCKVAYVDDQGTAGPDWELIDCNNATCSSRSVGTIEANVGTSTMNFHSDLDCIGGSSDCKVMTNIFVSGTYYATFYDCSNSTCSSNSFFDIGTNVGSENKVAMDCPTASNCKLALHEATNDLFVFADCGNAGCSSGNTFTTIDSTLPSATDEVGLDVECPASNDCKLIYTDPSVNEVYFVDCANETCTATGRTITTIDLDGGSLSGSTAPTMAMTCVSSTDCKFTYAGNLTSGAEQLYFVDCDDATCSSASVTEMAGPRFRAELDCVGGSSDCKFIYIEGTAGTDPVLMFGGCSTTNCFPTATTLTPPWTGQFNLTAATLSYDTVNDQLIASIIKQNSEEAFFKIYDEVSDAWGTQYSYGFTAGDLGHISSPMTGAGSSQIGVVLRQGSNFEFATLPENPWLLLLSLPAIIYIIRRRKRTVAYHRTT